MPSIFCSTNTSKYLPVSFTSKTDTDDEICFIVFLRRSSQTSAAIELRTEDRVLK